MGGFLLWKVIIMDFKNELELRKQLPVEKRLQYLEESVQDIEKLLDEFRKVIQLLNTGTNLKF